MTEPRNHANPPADATQAMHILPPELEMLGPLPPVPEESTQPLPLRLPEGVDPEVFEILGGPGATHVMKAAEPEAPAEASGTLVMPIIPAQPPADSTQTLAAGEPSEPLQTCAIPQVRSHLPQPRIVIEPRRGLPGWAWALMALLAVGALAVAIFVFRPGIMDRAAAPPPVPVEPAPAPPKEIPPALRAYHQKALEGDATAMHMLGLMYCQGLNVEKDTAEGLKWYQKAAAAGSKAAQKELKALEGVK